jgi:hypothetical protein
LASRGDVLDDLRDCDRAELRIEQRQVVAIIDQRTADREQAERRQVVVGNPAADRRMWRIHDQGSHDLVPAGAISQVGSALVAGKRRCGRGRKTL